VSNAIKFTPAGGRIDVSLARRGPDVVLCVRDTGIGFDPAVAAHLFERFRQGDSSTTRVFGGLGLGLGIVRHLVELHGGTVSAFSEGEKRGSVFEVRIPIRQLQEPAPTPDPAMAAPSLRGVSVLVVDDDPQALEFARHALEESGATVVTASSAREAKDRFDRQRPDVILSDVLMPGTDGLELMRQIRAMEAQLNGLRTPAAALTALARADDRSRALSAGFQMHLAKPVDPSELVVTVERLAHRPDAHSTVH
jgi:CheY-like chemotaxis protein